VTVLTPHTTLEPREWRAIARAHAARADELTARWREAHNAGRKHEIEDFLFSYYPIRPSRLRTWAAGAGTILLGDESDSRVSDELSQRASARWFTVRDGGVTLDVDSFMADRGSTVRYIHSVLSGTASRPTNLGCFGLHEWAMVYRQDETRHALPLRLGGDGTDQVVEDHKIRCTHFDAFRFFTPEAVPLNRLQPTRELQPVIEQPGCLHANMDLYKWAWKLSPAVRGDLLLDCFELARDIRYLDMQASPYDVSKFDLPPVRIETEDGKATYQEAQAQFAQRSEPLRARLIEVCEHLMAGL
jgi:hypothetical protein